MTTFIYSQAELQQYSFTDVFRKGETKLSEKRQPPSKNTEVGDYKVLHSQHVCKSVERNALVDMIHVIEATIERKQTILDAMNAFHKIFGDVQRCDLPHLEKDEFNSHYIWLQENLKLTEQALEAAMMHQ